ncbi:MAG: hypothetical protein HS111_21650 [Kofleriaceae bacterium]|nr:hypothetical protein [Kofleriaceae bacterium]
MDVQILLALAWQEGEVDDELLVVEQEHAVPVVVAGADPVAGRGVDRVRDGPGAGRVVVGQLAAVTSTQALAHEPFWRA